MVEGHLHTEFDAKQELINAEIMNILHILGAKGSEEDSNSMG